MFHKLAFIINTENNELSFNSYNITGQIATLYEQCIVLQGENSQETIRCKSDKPIYKLEPKQYIQIFMCTVKKDNKGIYIDISKKVPEIITEEQYQDTDWTSITNRNNFPKLMLSDNFINEPPCQCVPTKIEPNLRIISYNIQGLNKGKIKVLQSLYMREIPDILCLQETKCSNQDLENIVKLALPNFKIILNSAKQCKIQDYQFGVVVLVKSELIHTDSTDIHQSLFPALQHRFNLIEIAGQHLLINIYAPFSLNHYQDRMNFDQVLYNVVMQYKHHKIILVGDFNTVNTNYFEHKASCTDKEIYNYQKMIKHGDLHEVQVNNEQKMTIFNRHCSQVDHILIAKNVAVTNQRCLSEYYKCGSDHIPLAFDLLCEQQQQSSLNLVDDQQIYLDNVIKSIYSQDQDNVKLGVQQLICLLEQFPLNQKLVQILKEIVSQYNLIIPGPRSTLNKTIAKKLAELYVNQLFDELPQFISEVVYNFSSYDLINEYYIIINQLFKQFILVSNQDSQFFENPSNNLLLTKLYNHIQPYLLQNIEQYSQTNTSIQQSGEQQQFQQLTLKSQHGYQLSQIIMSIYSLDYNQISEYFKANQIDNQNMTRFIRYNINNSTDILSKQFYIQLAIKVTQIYISYSEYTQLPNMIHVLIVELFESLCKTENSNELYIIIVQSFIDWSEKVFKNAPNNIFSEQQLTKLCQVLYQSCIFSEQDVLKAEKFDQQYIQNQILNIDQNLTNVAGILLGHICQHNQNIEKKLKDSIQLKIDSQSLNIVFQQLQLFKILVTQSQIDHIVTQLRPQYKNDIIEFIKIVKYEYNQMQNYPVLYQGEIFKFYFDLFDQISQSELDYFLDNIPAVAFENEYTAIMLAQGFKRVINSKYIKNNIIKNSEQFVIKFLQSSEVTLHHDITCCQACCCLIKYCNTPINHFRDTYTLLFNLFINNFENQNILPFANLLLEQIQNVTQNMKIQFIQDLVNQIKYLPDNVLDNALLYIIQLLSICSKYCQSPLFNLIMNMSISQECHANAKLSHILLLFINNYISTPQFLNGEQMYIQTNLRLEQMVESHKKQISQLQEILIYLISTPQTASDAYQTVSLMIQYNIELDVKFLSQVVLQIIKFYDNEQHSNNNQIKKQITIFYCSLFNKYEQQIDTILKNTNNVININTILSQVHKGSKYFYKTDQKSFICEGLFKISINNRQVNQQLVINSIIQLFVVDTATPIFRKQYILNCVEHYIINEDPSDLKNIYIQKLKQYKQ
ncbi:Conserved_hypothetical protein [Hexamita inflata]|uniref:Endonuclease/exonuclease/phosphatase domain-containing protein n=1 Tax=Hexamita inflata TaxID=28002 RepID=A0AA86URZ0_9EUKA|nr:Conserved hypothetical protein [Hexamita inflata]